MLQLKEVNLSQGWEALLKQKPKIRHYNEKISIIAIRIWNPIERSFRENRASENE